MPQKTPEYTRRAVQKYRENKDQINLVLDKGIKARIETLTGEKASAYIKKLVMDDLQRMEAGNGPKDQEPKPQAVTDQEPTPDAVQALIDEKRKQYEREKEAEQTQEDAQKTRVFNMNDYK
jgi:hypothetical protein